MRPAHTGAANLILGMGNPILTDDAVGVKLAADLGKLLGPCPDVDVIEECSVGGLNLLEYMEGYERVVVLDAIHTRGGKPGELYYFQASALRQTAHLCNIHDANFATALALGRKLGQALPTDHEIHVFAVEVLDDRTFGTELTPCLARAYPGCLRQVYAGVLDIIPDLPHRPQRAPEMAEENHGTNHSTERPAVRAHPAVDAW